MRLHELKPRKQPSSYLLLGGTQILHIQTEFKEVTHSSYLVTLLVYLHMQEICKFHKQSRKLKHSEKNPTFEDDRQSPEIQQKKL
jgi:hypothetical protein